MPQGGDYKGGYGSSSGGGGASQNKQAANTGAMNSAVTDLPPYKNHLTKVRKLLIHAQLLPNVFMCNIDHFVVMCHFKQSVLRATTNENSSVP